jgi:hypothetical protein
MNSDGSAGDIYVYILNPNTANWERQTTLIISTGYFCDSSSCMSISDDGNILAIAVTGTQVSIQHRTGTSWSQSDSLTPSPADAGYARSVAMTASGSRLIVGSSGKVYIYDSTGVGTFTLQATITVTSTYVYGVVVDISDDGNTIAVSDSSYDPGVTGLVYIYKKNGVAWPQQGPALVPFNQFPGAVSFGMAIALSSDGNILVVGGPQNNNRRGAFWTFTNGLTAGPTKSPSFSPSKSPVTSKPSTSPTTSKPTTSPTRSPSRTPTTSKPSTSPTTSKPTTSPTTSKPTTSPSRTPTTSKPSISPTKIPTLAPTTKAPTTWAPSKSPTFTFVLTQQGSPLVGTGNTGASKQGTCTAINELGDTLVSGGSADNSNNGAIWIFTRSGTTWSQQTKITVSDNVGAPLLGHFDGCDLSGDGNTLIFGGLNDDSSRGAAWVYTRSGSTWTKQQKLTGANVGDEFGSGVGLSKDGNTAVVGAEHYTGANPGTAYVYTRSGGVWSLQQQLTLTGNVGVAYGGRAVTISNDGNTVAVGGINDNSNIGATWVFTRSGGVWTLFGSKLVGTGSSGSPQQGSSVSLSGDGNTLAVGGPGDNGALGAVWMFTRGGSSFTQVTKLIPTDPSSPSLFGCGVSMDYDGKGLVVGGSLDASSTGAIWMFNNGVATWVQQGSKVVGTGNTGAATQGSTVCISSIGAYVISGGPGDNTNVGATWVFTSGVTAAPVSG